MKNNNIILIVCLFMLFFSCNKGNETNNNSLLCVKVDLNDRIKLSEFADSVKFIRLSNENLLRDVSKLLLDKDENMYILDSNGDGIFKFDRTGKYVCQISRKGHGPGEYTKISDFDIFEDRMIVNDGYKQLFYHLDGTFISEQKEYFPRSVVWVNDTICESFGAQALGVYIDGKKTKFFKTKFTDNDLLAFHGFHFTKNGNHIYWEDCYNDTIYTIRGGKPLPYLYVDFGDLKLPSDISIDNTIEMDDKIKRYCFDVSGFKISDNFITFSFRHTNCFYVCIHNRQTSDSYVYKTLLNDVNIAQAGFFPMYIQNKVLYFVSPSEDIFNYYTALKESTEEEHQQMASRILEAVGGSIDEMDNPFIVAVTCK